MDTPTPLTLLPSLQFRYFPLQEKEPPTVFCVNTWGERYELRQAFYGSDGKTYWQAVAVASEAEQQEAQG